MPVISPVRQQVIIIYDDNPRGRDRRSARRRNTRLANDLPPSILLFLHRSYNLSEEGGGGRPSPLPAWKSEEEKEGARVRGTPARVTSGTQRSKSPWWFEKRETRKLRTFLMQKGSRSGAEVSRNNDGVPVEMIHPSNILWRLGGHHVAGAPTDLPLAGSYKWASCLFQAKLEKSDLNRYGWIGNGEQGLKEERKMYKIKKLGGRWESN